MKKILFNILVFLFVTNSSYAQSQCFEPDANIWKDTWASCQKTANPNLEYANSHWIQYDLGTARNLSKTWVWNTNDPTKLNQGFKLVTIDYSNDGENWTHWGQMNFPKANGQAVYGGFAGPDLQTIKARYVLITALSNHGHGTCAGLAEIKFNLLPSDDPGTPIREEDEEEGEEDEIADEDGDEEEEDEDEEEEEADDFEEEEDFDDEENEDANCEEVAALEIEIEIDDNEAFIFWEAPGDQDFFFIQYGPEGSDEFEMEELEEPELFIEDISPFFGYEFQIGFECDNEIIWSESILVEGEVGNRVLTSIPQLIAPTELRVNIFPNPTQGKFSFQYHSSNTDILQYTISNVEGKIILQQEYALESGLNTLPIDLSNMPDGVYFLNAINTRSGQVVNRSILMYAH